MSVVLTPVLNPSENDPRLRLWTRGEFDRILESDIVSENESVLLHDGQIYRFSERNPRLWTRNEYYRLAEIGILSWGERVELLEGEITEKVTIRPPHATATLKTTRALEAAFGPGCFARPGHPLFASAYSEPEPDVMMVPGVPDDYAEEHPVAADALLVVEVSDTTLRKDRGKKVRIYALAGCREYWVIDLRKRTLEVYRDPLGDGYDTIRLYKDTEAVTPLAAPQSSVRVSDLLPLVRTNL